jgi:hypothetical protein
MQSIFQNELLIQAIPIFFIFKFSIYILIDIRS